MKYIDAKTVIGKNNTVNLYKGCSHGCIYCDTRSKCYNILDYDEINVKRNAIEIFRRDIVGKYNQVISTGAMCDPYMHIEEEFMLTKKMLEIIYETFNGVGILTKSDLALRDIDLIEKINHRFKACVCYTITCIDDELSKILEPNVCVTSKRLHCLKEFHKRGILTGVWLCPILPFINDTEDNIIKIVDACYEAGVSYILVFDFGTTMRDGSREYFYNCLDKLFPKLKETYIKTYGMRYICPSLNSKKLWEVFIKQCKLRNIIYEFDKIKELQDNFNKHDLFHF